MLKSRFALIQKIGIRSALLAVGCLAGSTSAWAQTFVPVDPTTTYLHTNQDTGGDSPAILLSSLIFNGHALQPGDVITLAETGDFEFSVYQTPPQFGTGLNGIFSSSSTLLDSSLLDRVPNAVMAGDDVTTLPTFYGNEATDIPGDFGINSGTGTTLTIPAGAQYLFLSADEDYFGDDADPHNDFGVDISLAPAAVPEVSACVSLGLLLALGLGGMMLRTRRRIDEAQKI